MKNKIIMLFVIFIFALGTITYANGLFKDVKSNAWYYNSIQRVVSYGIMNGYPDDTFKPNENVTRAELSTVVSNLIYQQEEMMRQNNATDEQVINVVAKSLSSVVEVDTEDGFGTGFVIKYKGKSNHILTNHHVIEGSNNITVTLSNGKSYVGTVENTDKHNDLALLSIDETDELKYLEITEKVTQGQTNIAIGNPKGLTQSVTKGIVSHTNRWGMIQIDTAINAGNSGSPVLNLDGKVIGIATGKITGEKIDNLAFAVRGDVINAFLRGEILIYN